MNFVNQSGFTAAVTRGLFFAQPMAMLDKSG
jgi:hypothetical protein